MHSLPFLLLFISCIGFGEAQTISDIIGLPTTTQNPACQSVTTQWLAWSEWSACSDECGSCGIHTRTRTCLVLTTDLSLSSCTCPGVSTMIEYCNIFVCRYPKESCCYNFQPKPFSGSFACLDANSTTTTTPPPVPLT